MTARLEILLHLASVIDMKREKLEAALTDARRAQLSGQIDLLSKHFQSEYTEFVTPSGILSEFVPLQLSKYLR